LAPKKLNLTQQNQTCTSKPKDIKTKTRHKELNKFQHTVWNGLFLQRRARIP